MGNLYYAAAMRTDDTRVAQDYFAKAAGSFPLDHTLRRGPADYADFLNNVTRAIR